MTALIDDIATGRKIPKVYRQFKMYNDPQWVGPYRRFQDLTVDAYHDPGEHLAPSSQHRPGRMDRIQVADVVEKVEVWQQRYRA